MRSFFFRNIPDKCSLDTLHAKFNGVGKVLDVYCPGKQDKEGNRFGFVRFSGDQDFDEEKVLSMLNNIWIGSYNIRAYLPKFERNETKKQAPINRPFEVGKGLRNPERSYRDAYLNKDGS